MKIAIDGRVFAGKKTGVGHYVTELCRELDQIIPDAQFYVYNRDPVGLPVQGRRWIMRSASSIHAKRLKTIVWHKFVSGRLCQKDDIDVYWGAGSSLPFGLGRTNAVLTVYDLVYKLMPDTMYRFNLWAFRLFFRRDLYMADKVVTISHGTSKRLKAMLGRKSDAVVYPSVDRRFCQREHNEIQACLSRYDIEKPYLLTVATWEPRKNLSNLLKAFLWMKKDGQLPDYRLVLVGTRGWKDNDIVRLLYGNASESGVIHLGYVPRDDLAALYSGAAAFVFPSLYEGFGMPVLEARRCGAQVITSDIPELREAGGDDAIYISPTVDGIRAGILRCLNQKRRNFANMCLKTPTWKEGAQVMAKIFSDTVSYSQ